MPHILACLEELEKIAKSHKKNTFAGLEKRPIKPEEMMAYRKRLKAAGLRSSVGGYSNLPASLVKTEKGFAAYTHRARTKWYPSPEAIPLAKLKFIASTG